MIGKRLKVFFTVSTALLFTWAPAVGQQSKDTLRIAINDPFSVLDSYHFPQDEVGYFVRGMYGTLVAYDEHNKKFVPMLAKAWRQVNPSTIEFDLRDDVTLHSGNKFTSEDVKHTINYLADPKVRIRFKARYTWVKEVEKLGPHKVRIIAKKPSATMLSTIAYRFRMYDSAIHKKLEKKADYGRVSASSTGPYKMVFLDRTKGLMMERYDKFYGSPYDRSPIKRIHGIWMPDRQTQIAQLFTNGVDVLRNITADNAKDLSGKKGFAVTPSESKNLMYLWFDAVGRSKNKVMTDVRVRKAMIMAINREELVKTFVAGGEAAELPKSICFATTIACDPSTKPLGYNPAGAKRLLAEAGHPNGFELQLDVFAPIKEIAEAIAGYLQKVGIKTKLNPMPLMVYVKKRGAGDFTAFNGYYPTSAQPDVDNLLNFFFGANRDYWRDPLIKNAHKAGKSKFKLSERTATYVPALDQINKNAYIFPISELPIVYAHTDNITIKKNLLSAGERRIGDFFWN